MTATAKANFQPDTDVHITFEDQQRINNFAKHNAKFEDLKEELKNKQNELRNLEDVVEELELVDETEQIPFLVGEVFIYQDLENTQKSIATMKEKILSEIKEIEKKSVEISDAMSDLKTLLYAKFGNHINLEPEEE
ncbi:probable prefoldin subunit 4 [Halyomorpha halys]|uniref:probable prefoldin subunit 4 n=1 Tax=Halyomorpha halys TaxID=286706 RepID=UPI0006D51797|nr:probable prefoldin subunit 4 [Halyomorpha halys]